MEYNIRGIIRGVQRGAPEIKISSKLILRPPALRVSKRMRRGMGRKSASQMRLPFREGEEILPQFWQKRFYDFNVYSAAKRREKLEYMHRNPVTRRLVKDPKDWVWSSYSSYSGRGAPLVEIDFAD